MIPSTLQRNPLARLTEVGRQQRLPPVPTTLVCGFLGAGKTTLLNSLLAQSKGQRIAVLVNDFGALNIDARLIVKVEGQTVELADGCICCSIRDDLIAGVETVLNTSPRPEQLLIETSGISDPGNILCSLGQAELRRDLYVENVVTVVDALHALDSRDAEYRDLFERQLCNAYMAVINRVEMAAPEQRTAVREWIDRLAPGIAIVEAEEGAVATEVILGESRLGQSQFRPVPTASSRAHPFASMVWSTERPIRRTAFVETLAALSHTIFRAKGFVHFQHYPLATLFQKVGGQSSYIDAGAWGGVTPRTELVLIGSASTFDKQEVERMLDACCA
ncbi:MAG: GTP-binding protein [Algiphilus sp.]|uniref:CobW family GTP-binding protein n=1 Tax=Algiphilus sp. TaxID=1872431 RepID=UPI0032EE72C4